MSDHPSFVPEYCDWCGDTGHSNNKCPAFEGDRDDDLQPDDWGGMSWDERVQFVLMNRSNGNITDSINFIMHDGDVQADSVLLMLHIILDECQRTETKTAVGPDGEVNVNNLLPNVINGYINTIERWRTQ